MKIKIYLLAMIVCLVCLPVAYAQEYGKIRALQQRAHYVTKQKNDFVARVLTSYQIPHERNNQDVVVRIKMEGEWINIKTIEIVPIVRESDDKHGQVAAHELYFYTTKGILNLISELIIR